MSIDRGQSFEILCEIEPPTTGDLSIVREQIAMLQSTVDAFLVPDSHLGRATVSSIAVAHEVNYLGGRAVACLNARDRNLLGFRRDLLTAAAYGVREVLFVYGDQPSEGERSRLAVRQMLQEVREPRWAGEGLTSVGVAADSTRPLPSWKRDVSFVCTQLSFDSAAIGRWREANGFEGRVYAGVVVLASEKMVRRLMDAIPNLRVPYGVLDRIAKDPRAGVQMAVEQIVKLREAGAVDGVHLVPARRFRELPAALSEAGL